MLEGQMYSLGHFPDFFLLFLFFQWGTQHNSELNRVLVYYNNTTSGAEDAFNVHAALWANQAELQSLRCCAPLQPLCGSRTLHTLWSTSCLSQHLGFRGNVPWGMELEQGTGSQALLTILPLSLCVALGKSLSIHVSPSARVLTYQCLREGLWGLINFVNHL